ncbi:hypothetical protein CYMTET_32547 [Cymbomonas tetramitiformis]|uniref:Uncharacterized protein n=1 Tax=Cymbomonas tetramitiformis TaxID=36881 RepID=A0AAE0KRR7_9CHLO|nr:hypothetical protein CYMTET_32547 [Cymbomonas tetramitiformis]
MGCQVFLLMLVGFSRALSVVSQASNGGQAQWTIMIYGAGDNNLEEALIDDIEEMGASGVPGTQGKINVLVLADRSDSYSSQRLGGIGDWVTTKEILVENGRYSELKDFGELDLTEQSSLANFISSSISSYPAESYGLILWDHGMGWMGYGEDGKIPSGSKKVWEGADYAVTSPTIPLSTVHDAIQEGLKAASLERLDFLGFDSCLMQHYTVAANLVKFSHFFIASEDLEPFDGWDYTALSAVVSNPFITAADLSKAIIDKYVTQTGNNRPRTLASVSREGFDYFVLAFRLLLTELNDLLDKIPYGDSVAVYSTLAKVRSSGAMVVMEWERQEPGIDLGTLLHQLQLHMGEVPRVQALVQSALQAYQAMVVYHTAPPEEPGNTGMAIYFPKTAADMDTIDAEWSVITPPFGQMDSITIWLSFLQKYYAAAATVTVLLILEGYSSSVFALHLYHHRCAAVGATANVRRVRNGVQGSGIARRALLLPRA